MYFRMTASAQHYQVIWRVISAVFVDMMNDGKSLTAAYLAAPYFGVQPAIVVSVMAQAIYITMILCSALISTASDTYSDIGIICLAANHNITAALLLSAAFTVISLPRLKGKRLTAQPAYKLLFFNDHSRSPYLFPTDTSATRDIKFGSGGGVSIHFFTSPFASSTWSSLTRKTRLSCTVRIGRI